MEYVIPGGQIHLKELPCAMQVPPLQVFGSQMLPLEGVSQRYPAKFGLQTQKVELPTPSSTHSPLFSHKLNSGLEQSVPKFQGKNKEAQ